jgi:hypothetical protein
MDISKALNFERFVLTRGLARGSQGVAVHAIELASHGCLT